MVQRFCLIPRRLCIWWTNVIVGILDPCDVDLPHKMYLINDVHSMVQWFCFISWRLFDGGILYWRYWFSATLSLTYKYICRSVTYILWYSDSAMLSILFDEQASFFRDWFWYELFTCISWFSDLNNEKRPCCRKSEKRVAFNVVYIINAFNLPFLSVCEQKLGSFFKFINGIRWLQIKPCGDNALISVALCRVMNEKKGFCFAQ